MRTFILLQEQIVNGTTSGKSLKDPDGTLVRSVETAYDLRDRISQINEAGSLTQQVHDAVGNLIRSSDPNSNAAQGCANAAGAGDGMDAGGRATQGAVAGCAGAAATTTYAYDALDRLTGETSPVETLGYAYDANGNRITRTENGKVVTYSYTPNSNRMDKIGKKTITLDAAGNTVADRNGLRTFEYDAAGHLKQVALNGEVRGNYAYNVFHQRTRKVKRNGVTFLYHYDQQGRVLSESRNGQPWKDYVWADDEPIAQIRVHKNAKGKLLVKDIVYLTADHLNTPRIGTDANAEVVWRWEGDAFGDTKTDNDPDDDDKNVTVNLRFPGQYFDSETGLHYNWHRYYDPKIGRYVTSDPIGLGGGINTFSYTRNNPQRFSDPLGLYIPAWHKYFTIRGALLAGYSYEKAQELAKLVVQVDYESVYPGTQKPWSAHMHAMCAEGLDRFQCMVNFSNYVANSMNSCSKTGLAKAVHAVQDFFAGGHQDFHEYHGLYVLGMIPHFLWDLVPSPGEVYYVPQVTRDLIEQFNTQCACSK